tara:strand:- start:695 stop:1012 length:318 start_codon:yes stop_codon:yes gene_type:complete
VKIASVIGLLILIPIANADYQLASGDTRSGTGHDPHKIFLQELRADANSRMQDLFRALLSTVVASRAGALVKEPSEDPIGQDSLDQDSLEMGFFDESRWNEAVYD